VFTELQVSQFRRCLAECFDLRFNGFFVKFPANERVRERINVDLLKDQIDVGLAETFLLLEMMQEEYQEVGFRQAVQVLVFIQDVVE
jgi:hypothetical protein